MKTSRRYLILALAALSLAGCASKPELSRIQDPDIDFRAYRSFAFFPGRSSGYPSLVEKRLVAATREQLERRGYVLDETAPDMLVNIAAVVEERQGPRKTPGPFSGLNEAQTEDYRLGRLAIDLFDARQREIVWHGAAEGRLSRSMLLDTGAAAEKAVATIFEGFPIKAGAHAGPGSAQTAPPASKSPTARPSNGGVPT